MENVLPKSNIIDENLFVNLENYLSPVLNQADYLSTGEEGQCLGVALGDTLQARRNVSSLQGGGGMAQLLSVQQIVDAMTPKPANYKDAVLGYLQNTGVVSKDDYVSAPAIPRRRIKNVEGLTKFKILGQKTMICKTCMNGYHQREEIVKYGETFGPLVASFMATKELFSYRDGILTGTNYHRTNDRAPQIAMHAAMVLGYGVAYRRHNIDLMDTSDNEEDIYYVDDDNNLVEYWLCRNNWGPAYGFDQGLFRIDAELVNYVISPAISEMELAKYGALI